MENKFQDLTKYQWKYLVKLLQKIEGLFNGKLCTWKTDPIHFELKYNDKPICY